MKSFTSIAPGRLCLFGEHQDYLGLPVISCAIPLYVRIAVTPLPHDRVLRLHIPQLQQTKEYHLNDLPPRQKKEDLTETPDFALAAIHEALDDKWEFPIGAHCVSTTEFVMQAGCSSSSAFCVAWIQVLAALAGKDITPEELAKRAYTAEVTHFGAPGGTMDHVTSALGGWLRIGPGKWDYERLPAHHTEDLGVWILAYSGQPKDTLKHLKRCKTARLELLEKLGGSWESESKELSEEDRVLLEATLINRDTERMAYEIWATKHDDVHDKGHQLGRLLSKHHNSLRDGLGLSTEQLEQMNHAALTAGAYGFKVVGSGGGGCGIAWACEQDAEKVMEALRKAGSPFAWIIKEPANGARVEY